jgi:ribosome-binding protein aMBF1 (putative translation factor)
MKADQVAILRERLGLERSELAWACGADVRSVIRWEKGRSQPSGAASQVLDALWNVSAWKPEALRRYVSGNSLMRWAEKALRDALPPDEPGEPVW